MKINAEILSHGEHLFYKIMKLDNVEPLDIMNSLNLDANRKSVFRAGEGSGQSGSFFFFSNDNRFIIKTLRGKEKENLLGMLEDMVDYF